MFATKKELMYMGLITIGFLLIVAVLALTLPLSKSIPKDTNAPKDVNNFNPAFDQNNDSVIKQLAEDTNKAYLECVNLCNEFKDKNGENYSNGPCLSDMYGFKVKDWACDIAHLPRTTEDNDSKNQCKTVLNGTANRFVELDTNCNILR